MGDGSKPNKNEDGIAKSRSGTAAKKMAQLIKENEKLRNANAALKNSNAALKKENRAQKQTIKQLRAAVDRLQKSLDIQARKTARTENALNEVLRRLNVADNAHTPTSKQLMRETRKEQAAEDKKRTGKRPGPKDGHPRPD